VAELPGRQRTESCSTGPIIKRNDHPGAQRIQDHITSQLQQVDFLLHQDRLVAPLKEVPDQAVAAVEALRIKTVQVPHPERQIAIRRLQQQVIVIGHLAEGVHHPVEASANNAQHLQPVDAVSIVQENVFPSIPARGDMINGPRQFEP
jgi:hypothetical protein